MPGANTRMTYEYRDASNYKQSHAVVFAGRVTDGHRRRIAASLDEGTYFIAEQVGLPNLRERWETHNDDDHVWHELEPFEGLEPTDDAPTEQRTLDEFVEALAGTTWDEDAAIEQLERWKRATPEGH